MAELIRAFFDITLRRRGPEDLPASGFLLGLVLGCYALVSGLGVAVYARSVADFSAQLALDLALFFGFFVLLLALYRRTGRLLQTLTALLGTGAMLSAIALPLLLWLRTEDPETPGAGVPALGMYLLVLWSLMVTGHILHRALEIPFVGGMVLALGYFTLNIAAFGYLFPAGT